MAIVLCVDVGPAVAAVLEHLLRDLKHEPVHASSVDEAILALHDRQFDLAILDTSVPERDGSRFLQHLRDQSIPVPTIVLADFSSVDHAMAALTHGAVDYLTKPLRAESVRIAVNNTLEIDRLRKETKKVRRDIALMRAPSAIVERSATTPEELIPPSPSPDDVVLNLRELEAIAIRQALKLTGGHRMKAADLLGINERTLRNKLKTDELKDSVPPRPMSGVTRR